MPRILLVEDEDSLRHMLGLILRKMGHEVMEAANGKEALELCLVEPPDVVVTDLVMPDKEGLETIREIRQLQPDIKIIAMSGGGRVNATDYLAIARKLGADQTLTKPFSNEALAAAIRSVISP